MKLSVLERQRAVLQRLHNNQTDSWNNQPNDHHSYRAVVSDSNNSSSVTRLPVPKHVWQCDSSSENRKRKAAEFDIEEDERKGIRVEAEEARDEKSEITTKTERETSANTCSKESSKVSEVQKPDYIHVRARRGQATDSHSLAERARREKISKKMKCLQDLVPGCNKVTGKAGMLDEIINYVQSLQKQVEFLSMKLAAINPRLNFRMDNIFAKEIIKFPPQFPYQQIPAYNASLPTAAQFEATSSTCFQYNPVQQGTSNYEPDVALMDQSQILPQKAGTSSLPTPDMFLDSSCFSQLQQLLGWESDWYNLFSAGFH